MLGLNVRDDDNENWLEDPFTTLLPNIVSKKSEKHFFFFLISVSFKALKFVILQKISRSLISETVLVLYGIKLSYRD